MHEGARRFIMRQEYRNNMFIIVLIISLSLVVTACTAGTNTADSSFNQPAGSPSNSGNTLSPPTTSDNSGPQVVPSSTPAPSSSAGDLNSDVSQTPPTSTVSGQADTVVVNVKAQQFSFNPSEIDLKKGQHVKLVITSPDVAHGITAIPELGIPNTQIPAGQTVTIEFDATQTGTFPFRCSVFCGEGHRAMTGELVVT
jgi:cytochrome c oxidase subunit 2